MKKVQSLSVVHDVTLISLQDSPADISIIADIFDMISKAGIDVDMISQTPPSSKGSSLSFTVSDDDFGKILDISAKLREINPEIKFNVSSGNSKVSIFSEEMRGLPGIAAKVFKAVAAAGADIRMITTSEIDISLLVVKSDVGNTINSLLAFFS